MSLVAFEDATRAHFANPPATWRLQPGPGGWHVVDLHGAVLDTCVTQAHAEDCRHSGPAAQRWHRRTDWYLGYEAGVGLSPSWNGSSWPPSSTPSPTPTSRSVTPLAFDQPASSIKNPRTTASGWPLYSPTAATASAEPH